MLAERTIDIEPVSIGLEKDARYVVSLLQMMRNQALRTVGMLLGFRHAAYPEHLSSEGMRVPALHTANRVQRVEGGAAGEFCGLLFRKRSYLNGSIHGILQT